MYSLLFKQFSRTRTCMLGLLIIFTLGVISIIIGKHYLAEQEKATAQVIEQQLAHIERNVHLHYDDLGLLLYYLKFSLINESSPLSGLSIGQRDVNPSVLSASILTLEGQKYDTDLVNPTQLLYGNLDLSFLLVYVFPLIIIAFSYNLRSEEEEMGTWRLVSLLANSTQVFLLKKLSVRVILLLSVMITLFLIATISLQIPWDTSFLLFVTASLLYLLFWFALSFWIVSFQRNSDFNAISLLSIWLALVVLLPATINTLITTQYPVPEALSTIIKQRDAYHQKWDTNKRATMDKFYASYPQFESYGYPTEEGFTWLWYYAMQHAGDAESREESASMRDKILQRETISRNWAYVVPSMHTQLLFNELAGTHLSNHIDFLEYVQEFHERTRLFFYPRIFSERNAHEIDWTQFQPETWNAARDIDWITILLPLVIAIVIFSGLATINHWKSS
ncbi:MAG: DUF3526 domain-containing protein [Bacteroidota bacterium]